MLGALWLSDAGRIDNFWFWMCGLKLVVAGRNDKSWL
jgi:hypothetical protein